MRVIFMRLMLMRMMPVRTTHNENLDFDDAVYAEVPGKELLEIMTILFNNHVVFL